MLISVFCYVMLLRKCQFDAHRHLNVAFLHKCLAFVLLFLITTKSIELVNLFNRKDEVSN